MDKETTKNMYQNLLHKKDPYTHFSNFSNQAESFNSKDSNYDIVKEYLHLSGNGQEFLPYIKELQNTDSQHVVSVLKSLCHILIRVSSDLQAFVSVANAIVNEILSNAMRTIFNFLQFKQKSSRTKLALHLLSSMVALGSRTALKVVTKLNFAHVRFSHLLNRCNFSEDEDVRTAFLNLIVLIITICNDNIIRQLVEIKGFLNSIIPGLTSDRVSSIILVLSTFKTKIVENPSIAKTSKIRLFNDFSLKPIIQLYTWKGPLVTKRVGKRKLGEEERRIAYEVDAEDILSVQNAAHEFMKSLCCSYKHGILFRDDSFTSSERNANNVITNILKSFPRPYSHKLITELIISILEVSPDQMQFYLPSLKDSFTPRISTSWISALTFLKKIISKMDPITCLFKSENKRPLTTLLTISKLFCLSDVIVASEVSAAFQTGHYVLCYHLCDILISILSQAKKILEFCSNPEVQDIPYNEADISEFYSAYQSTVLLSLPFSKDIQMYWTKITSEKGCVGENIIIGIDFPTLSEQVIRILEVFELYQIVSHNSKEGCNINFQMLFTNLKDFGVLIQQEKLLVVYTKIVDILSQSDECLILRKEDNADFFLNFLLHLYVACHKTKEANGALAIIYKVFQHTKLFDNCMWEIDIWLDGLKSAKSKHIPFLFELIDNAFNSYFINSKEFKAEMNNMLKVEARKRIYVSGEFESGNADKDSKLTESRQGFSYFVPAILFQLHLQEPLIKGCQDYVEKALLSIVHHQEFPELLLKTVRKYKSIINPSLHNYFTFLGTSELESMDIEETDCSTISDFSHHLKYMFIKNHIEKNNISCLCDKNDQLCSLGELQLKNIVWQILIYIDFEVKTQLNESTANSVLRYIELLKTILTPNEEIHIEEDQTLNIISLISQEILSHHIIKKLFLGFEKDTDNIHLLKCISEISNFVLWILQNCFSLKTSSIELQPYKVAIFRFLQNGLIASRESINLISLIISFLPSFSMDDAVLLLEKLTDNSEDVLCFYTTVVLAIIEMLLERSHFVLISPKCINSLFTIFATVKSKKKKLLQSYFIKLFDRHPSSSLFVTKDSVKRVIHQKSIKDLPLWMLLISENSEIRNYLQSFVMEMNSEEDSDYFMYLTSICINILCPQNELDNTFQSSISSAFWKIVTTFLCKNTDEKVLDSNVGKALATVVYNKNISFKKFNKFCHRLIENYDQDTVPSEAKLSILLQFFNALDLNNIESKATSLLILKVTLSWISKLLSESFNNWNLTASVKCILKNQDEIELSDLIEIDTFSTKILKFALKLEDVGKDLIQVLILLIEKSKKDNLPLQSIYSLLTAHSNFFPEMLKADQKDDSLKYNIIELLILLIKLEPSLCKENHLGLILSAYGATMSRTDQKLLFLLRMYCDNKINMVDYSPFLWGKSAIAHYSVMNSGPMHLSKKPRLQDITSLLSVEKIDYTILNFPLQLKLQPEIVIMENDDIIFQQTYDLRFFLPLIAHILSPGAFIHFHTLLESKLIMLVFVSLSSFDEKMRALGFYCLAQFYHHLEETNFKEKSIWLSLLESLQNSISSSNPRVPSIVSLFLAQTANIFTTPDHHLFSVLYKFIMVKPCLDIAQVPEFYKLFNSIDVEYRIHRLWLLNLIADGLRSSLDFHICEKRYIFASLMTHFLSSVATQQERVAILKIISSAVKIYSSARILCQSGLLIWLNNIVEHFDVNQNAQLFTCIRNVLDRLQLTFKEPDLSKKYTSNFEETKDTENQNISGHEKPTAHNDKKIYLAFENEIRYVELSLLRKLK